MSAAGATPTPVAPDYVQRLSPYTPGKPIDDGHLVAVLAQEPRRGRADDAGAEDQNFQGAPL